MKQLCIETVCNHKSYSECGAVANYAQKKFRNVRNRERQGGEHFSVTARAGKQIDMLNIKGALQNTAMSVLPSMSGEISFIAISLGKMVEGH